MSSRDDDAPKDPFRMLEKSHRRLLENLELLRGAVSRLPDLRAVADVREVAAFVAKSVPRHERDEEESLFPRLRDDGDLAPILAELEEEHRAHLTLHAELAELAATDAPDAARLQDLSRRLDAAYERHVDVEESRVFPAARAVLADLDLAAMADEMQARRGRGEGGGRREGPPGADAGPARGRDAGGRDAGGREGGGGGGGRDGDGGGGGGRRDSDGGRGGRDSGGGGGSRRRGGPRA